MSSLTYEFDVVVVGAHKKRKANRKSADKKLER